MNIHISRNGQTFGPYSMNDVQTGLNSGNIVETDLAWYEGAPDWLPISQVQGLTIPTRNVVPPPMPMQDVSAATTAHTTYAGETSLNPQYAQLHPAFQRDRYIVRRNIFTLFGAKLRVLDETGNTVLFSKMKAFKLKEDITIFTDDSMTRPLVRIRARRIIDFAATYDVFDTSAGREQKIGALRRKGLKSLIRDEWLVFDTRDQQIGLIQEESTGLAIIRRFVDFVAMFFPQRYNFTLGNQPVGFMKRNFNPFVSKVHVDFSQDSHGYFDRRLAAAAAILLVVIEGKQD